MQFNVKTKQDLQNLISDLNNSDYVISLEADIDHQKLVDLMDNEEWNGSQAVGVAPLKGVNTDSGGGVKPLSL